MGAGLDWCRMVRAAGGWLTLALAGLGKCRLVGKWRLVLRGGGWGIWGPDGAAGGKDGGAECLWQC